MSGLLAALSLSKIDREGGAPLSIAIVESSAINENVDLTFDDRVLALSHGSAQYLMSIGAWQYLAAYAEPIQNIHISDKGHYGKARIVAEKHSVEALGYVVELKLIGKALLEALKSVENVSWYAPDHIVEVDWHKEQVDLLLSSQTPITAKLLLGCDGVSSKCREFANISFEHTDYEQSALIANVSTEHSHENIAYERFTEFGPIAMLPLSKSSDGQNRCSLVWTLPPEKAIEMSKIDESAFKSALEGEFGQWLGKITYTGNRFSYPLVLMKASEQTFHRMVLIGNASHTIHPIAGQGFNLGLRDVSELTKAIASALNNSIDIGTLALLSEYAENRSKDHKEVIQLTDSLVTLFSNQLPPMVVGRNIGLKVLNYINPIKRLLVKKTMGY